MIGISRSSCSGNSVEDILGGVASFVGLFSYWYTIQY